MTELPKRRATAPFKLLRAYLVAGLALGLVPACGGDDSPAPTNTGASCTAVEQCYPGIKQTDLMGTAQCLDKITGGFCTHSCSADSDCCAIKGECPSQRAEVCSPLESTGDTYCFLSCEAADLAAANVSDSTQYCHTFAGAAFGCRSTGGGSKNRKVCLP